jgi:hypothetical protein
VSTAARPVSLKPRPDESVPPTFVQPKTPAEKSPFRSCEVIGGATVGVGLAVLVGVGLAVLVGVGEAVELAEGVGVEVGPVVAVVVAVAVGDDVGLLVGVGDGVGLGVGVGGGSALASTVTLSTWKVASAAEATARIVTRRWAVPAPAVSVAVLNCWYAAPSPGSETDTELPTRPPTPSVISSSIVTPLIDASSS